MSVGGDVVRSVTVRMACSVVISKPLDKLLEAMNSTYLMGSPLVPYLQWTKLDDLDAMLRYELSCGFVDVMQMTWLDPCSFSLDRWA